MKQTATEKPVLPRREIRPGKNFQRRTHAISTQKKDPLLHSILVPIDFSNTSRAALRYAVKLAQDYKADISLIHVVEPEYYNFVSDIILSKSTITFVEAATARLTQLAKEEIPAEIPARPWVQIGAPYEEIASAAKILNADWIVIATHGYTGFRHALLGSTAERVVRHAPCPVLIVREAQVQPQKGTV